MIDLMTAMLAYYCVSLALFLLLLEYSASRREALLEIEAVRERPKTFMFLIANLFLPMAVLRLLMGLLEPRS